MIFRTRIFFSGQGTYRNQTFCKKIGREMSRTASAMAETICPPHIEGRHPMLYFNIQRTEKYCIAMCQDGTTAWRSTSDGVKPGLDVFLELRLYLRLVRLVLRKKMTLINVQWLMTAFCLLSPELLRDIEDLKVLNKELEISTLPQSI